jgi:hypothetical protein
MTQQMSVFYCTDNIVCITNYVDVVAYIYIFQNILIIEYSYVSHICSKTDQRGPWRGLTTRKPSKSPWRGLTTRKLYEKGHWRGLNTRKPIYLRYRMFNMFGFRIVISP